MATNIVFVSIGIVLGLSLCFSSYNFKRKPYLYVRNAFVTAFGALFLLSMLLGFSSSTTLRGIGFQAMIENLRATNAWWQLILKLIVPLIVALTTIFLAELPQKAYEIISALFVDIPIICGLYISQDVSDSLLIGLSIAYGFALIAVGILMFRTYLCIEICATGALIVAWLLKGFYSLSTITFIIIASILALAGFITTLAFAKKKEDKTKRKDKSTSKAKDTEDDKIQDKTPNDTPHEQVNGEKVVQDSNIDNC